MRASVRRTSVAILCIAAITAVGLVALGGSERGTGYQARAQGAGPEPPGPFPDVYAPGTPTRCRRARRDEHVPGRPLPPAQPKQPGVMDFQHYHAEAEINWWMRKWAYDHPDIVELKQVGTSFGGKPIYQLTITNKALRRRHRQAGGVLRRRPPLGRDHRLRGVLYLAWKLITRYGTDRDITRMVDDKAIYLRPLSNPDGGDMYRSTAQTNRSSIRPTDNNGNGLLDDASPQDLNGDGYVTQIRRNVGAGNGNYIVDGRDPTGRTMRRVADGEGNYTLQSESPGSDAIGGLDLHRNYPYNWRPMPGQDATGRGWTQGGAGEYPLSEPEIRSAYDFLIRNPNIGAVNSMDTARRHGPARPLDVRRRGVRQAKRDIKLLEHLDKVGQRLTDYTRAGNVYQDYAVQPPRQAEGSTRRPQASRSRCSATARTSATSSSAPSGTATSCGSPAAA